MRQISFSIGNSVNLRPINADQQQQTYDPFERRDQLNKSLRRRLSDDLEALIHKACQRGHIGTAEELLIVLRNLIDWEREHFPHGRRPVEGTLDRLAAEISAARLLRRDAA
jgi:hypothetical protein